MKKSRKEKKCDAPHTGLKSSGQKRFERQRDRSIHPGYEGSSIEGRICGFVGEREGVDCSVTTCGQLLALNAEESRLCNKTRNRIRRILNGRPFN